MLLPFLVAAAANFAPGAPRYWPKYGGTREVRLLDGTWNYGYIDGWNSGFDSMSKTFSPKLGVTPNKTVVPSCMDVVAGGASGYLGPRGVAMYRTSFASPSSGAPVRLQFQACSFYCRVWVNGKEVGEHLAGGYVAFHLDVPAETLVDGDGNELFVLADNRFNHTTAPMHTGGDFWHYGGLIRSVELHTMSAVAPVVWRAHVLPSHSDVTHDETGDGAANGAPDSIDLYIDLSDERASGSVLPVRLAFDDGDAVEMKLTVSGRVATAKAIKVPNATPWSPESAHLHTLTVSVHGGTLAERFGLRRFGVDPASKRLTINGKVTKLVGWNHHTQWPVTAASPTDAQIDADIALLKQGHANVRHPAPCTMYPVPRSPCTYLHPATQAGARQRPSAILPRCLAAARPPSPLTPSVGRLPPPQLVRGAHYPHDPRMMDRLDEAGILFWSETLGPAVSLANTQDWDYFMKYQLIQMQEMLGTHASIHGRGCPM